MSRCLYGDDIISGSVLIKKHDKYSGRIAFVPLFAQDSAPSQSQLSTRLHHSHSSIRVSSEVTLVPGELPSNTWQLVTELIG